MSLIVSDGNMTTIKRINQNAKEDISSISLVQWKHNRKLEITVRFEGLILATIILCHSSYEQIFEMYKKAVPFSPGPSNSTNDEDFIDIKRIHMI